MSQSGQPALAPTARALARSRRFLVLAAAALTAGAEALLHPLFILPLIVWESRERLNVPFIPDIGVDRLLRLLWPVTFQPEQLTGRATLIGLLTAAAVAAWLLPQLVVEPAGWRNLPAQWASWLMAVRAGLAALLIVVLLTMASSANTMTNALLLIIASFWAVGGLLAIGRPAGLLTDADDQADGTHAVAWEQYGFWGGSLAVLGGLLVAGLLSPEGPAFPGWAVLVAGLAATGLALAALLTWRVSQVTAPATGPAWLHLVIVPTLLTHGRRLRRYVVFRTLLMVSALADPFYLVYSLRALDLPLQSVGIYVALFALVRMVTGLAYPVLTAAGYARLLGQTAALARLLIPLLALTLPLILRSAPITRPDAVWLGPTAFAGIIVLFGLATAGTDAADTTYLRDALAPAHRPAVRALLLTLLALLSVVYIIGGLIADRWGFEALLLVAFGVGLLAVFASGLLVGVPPAATRDLTASGALPTFRDSVDW